MSERLTDEEREALRVHRDLTQQQLANRVQRIVNAHVAAVVAETRAMVAREIEAESIPWALSDVGQRGWDMGRADAARIARGNS